MRVFGYSLAVAALAATCASSLHSQTVDSAQVLAGAREALGGEKKLSAVKTFTATGRTRQVRGNNLVPIEFEINCELPDKFVRKDESPAQDTDPTTLGFSGDALIQFGAPPGGSQRGQGGGPAGPPGPPAGAPGPAAGAPAPPGAGRGPAPPEGRRGGGPALNPAQQRLATVKQDFVRLTLGMFATSFSSFPLTFKYAGEGEAPEGKADVLDVSGPSNFAARFVVQRETHLPVMLMWQGPPTPNQAKPADFRLYYGDFRDVDGLKFPFRIRRAIGSETIEETTLDRIRINAKIDPRKFEVSK
jgi:hypothetical protein